MFNYTLIDNSILYKKIRIHHNKKFRNKVAIEVSNEIIH